MIVEQALETIDSEILKVVRNNGGKLDTKRLKETMPAIFDRTTEAGGHGYGQGMFIFRLHDSDKARICQTMPRAPKYLVVPEHPNYNDPSVRKLQ